MLGRRIGAAALACAALIGASGVMAADEEADGAKKKAAFYQKAATASCGGGTCTATFTKIPGGKVLQTTNLSCNVISDGFNAFAQLQAGDTILAFLPLLPFVSGTTTSATGVSTGTVFIDKGKTPSVVIAGGALSATCTISGALVSD